MFSLARSREAERKKVEELSGSRGDENSLPIGEEPEEEIARDWLDTTTNFLDSRVISVPNKPISLNLQGGVLACVTEESKFVQTFNPYTGVALVPPLSPNLPSTLAHSPPHSAHSLTSLSLTHCVRSL